MTRQGAVALLLVLCVGCRDRSEASISAAAVAPQSPDPAPTVTTPPIEPSPAVKALLAPDPDLDVKITPEEVKATLAAAAGRAEPSASSGKAQATAAASDEWRRLEEKQSDRNADYQAKLEGTAVFTSANDSLYHSRDCPTLNERREVTQPDGTRVLRNVFSGISSSLATATDRRMMAHASCRPPTVSFTY